MNAKQNIRIVMVMAIIFVGLMVYEPWKEAYSAQTSKLSMVSAFLASGPQGRTKNLGGFLFMEQFNEMAKGRYEINVIGGPEVISAADHLKVLRSGQFDLAITAAQYYPELRDIQTHEYFFPEKLSELSPQLTPLFQRISREQADVVWISPLNSGTNQYLWTSKKRVKSTADLAGLKIRTVGDLRTTMKKHLGIVPVNIPASEIYSALQNRVVDGVCRGMASLDLENEGEVLKYGILMKRLCNAGDIFMSGRTWDKLPADIKQLINDVALKAQRACLEDSYEKYRRIQSNIEKRFGCEIVEPDPELKHLLDDVIPDETLKILLENSKYRKELIETLKMEKVL